MNKQKIGKYFYFSALILAIVVFIFGRTMLPKDSLSEDLYIRYSNLIQFSIFGIIIPIGVIVREFLLLPYNKKIMTSKIIILSLVAIGGIVMFFVLPTITASSIILYLAYASLIFILIPSNSFRKFDK